MSSSHRKKRSITVQFVQETPAGYISVVDVKNFKATTNHRVVVSLGVQKSELKGTLQINRLG